MTITLPTPKSTPIKKVLILGAECTGKSTLSQDLANHFNTVFVSEYMRTYLQTKPAGYICQYSDLLPIAQGQILNENQQLLFAHDYLFCDTGLFELMVYANWYFDHCPIFIIKHIKKYPYDYILLTDDKGVDWQADGMRDMPYGRATIKEKFMLALKDFGFNYLEIYGNRKERVMQVENLLKSS